MRSVIGRDRVDRSVGEAEAQRRHIVSGSKRRVDLEDRVIAGDHVVSEDEVVRGHLRRDVPPLALGPAHQLDRTRGRDVAEVHPSAHVRGQQAVAGDDRLLGHGGPSDEAQTSRHDALVHLGAVGQAGILRVLGYDPVERAEIFQRPAHEHRVVDAMAVVGEDPHPGSGLGHRAELSELLAAQPHGDRPDRVDIAVARILAEPPDLLDDAGDVGDRFSVGHRVHGGEPAQRGGKRAGLDGFRVLPARLPQVGVQVDKPGQGDQPTGVERLGAHRLVLDNDPVVDVQICRLIAKRPHSAQDPRTHAATSGVSASCPPRSR